MMVMRDSVEALLILFTLAIRLVIIVRLNGNDCDWSKILVTPFERKEKKSSAYQSISFKRKKLHIFISKIPIQIKFKRIFSYFDDCPLDID